MTHDLKFFAAYPASEDTVAALNLLATHVLLDPRVRADRDQLLFHLNRLAIPCSNPAATLAESHEALQRLLLRVIASTATHCDPTVTIP